MAVSIDENISHTLFLRTSFVGATLPTQFLIDRFPPHRPQRLRTVVGVSDQDINKMQGDQHQLQTR
jgi:hypothetical protein